MYLLHHCNMSLLILKVHTTAQHSDYTTQSKVSVTDSPQYTSTYTIINGQCKGTNKIH